MKSYTAPAFSEKFISLRSSWRYCLDSFAGTFEELLQRVQKTFGSNVEWMNFEEISKHYCP